MSVAYRDQGEVQVTGSDRGQVSVIDTKAASSKSTTAPGAE